MQQLSSLFDTCKYSAPRDAPISAVLIWAQDIVGFVLVQYGAPAVAIVAVALSFFTARRRWGILVPVCAWGLLAIAVAVLIVTFRN